jgi:hypothetical protein
MNYKKLFYGYLTFNIIAGMIVGFIRATQQAKVNQRLNVPKMSDKMQEMVNHYTNKEKVA